MKLFNRVVAILTFLLTIIATLLTMGAVFLPRVYQSVIGSWVGWYADIFDKMPITQRLFVGGVGALLILVCLLLILLELRPSKGPKAITIQQPGGTKMSLATESIARRLEQRITEIEDVVRVKPNIHGTRGGAINVELDVETSPAVEVPMKTQEIHDASQQVIEEQMGLTLGKFKVNMTHSRNA